MASDFVVVIDVRHHFGNETGYFGPNLLFAEKNKEFHFDCPGLDPRSWAVMMFQARDVDNDKNHLSVNGNVIFGGIPISSRKDDWNANVALINPAWLQAADNVLRIGSRDDRGSLLGDTDDFMIDNLVVLYRT